MKTKLLSSLTKVFRDVSPNFPDFTKGTCLSNEVFSFQASIYAEAKEEADITLSIDSPLKDRINTYIVKNIPAGINGYEDSDSFRYDPERKEFPELLMPCGNQITIPEKEYHSIWFEVSPKGLSGEQKININLSANGKESELCFVLHVIDAELPEQKLLYTNWFHNDCLCTWYKVEPFSDKYWEIAENYIKNASEHGLNLLMTPVFTPPLDTAVGGERPTFQLVKVSKDGNDYTFDFKDFERYIDIGLRNNIKAFEISHLFTQWGATSAPKIMVTVNGKEEKLFGWDTDANGEEYIHFLECFAEAFDKEVTSLGIKELCWLHVSDEPSLEQIENYKKAASTLQRIFPDYKMLDALSDIDFYHTGLVKTPIPNEHEADKFKPFVKEFWTYHCCAQTHSFLPNRLFAHPSQRNRVIGVLLYKYDAHGFLQWGHNFWYSQYSVKEINPFEITDAINAFPSGDSFVVYPGEDGKPLNSLRHLVFADAMQDLRALQLLEKLTSREYTMELIEEGLDLPLSFHTYPHEQGWLLDLRERINLAIKNHS